MERPLNYRTLDYDASLMGRMECEINVAFREAIMLHKDFPVIIESRSTCFLLYDDRFFFTLQ